jgi:3-oxoadipate enol-lactonase
LLIAGCSLISVICGEQEAPMPFANVNNARMFYRLEGRAGLPVLVMSHSLGCDLGMWEPQMPQLLERMQVLRYDTRGHGASDVPAGDCSLDDLGRDVLGLAGFLNIPKFGFCGLSMGGAIGQWLAIEVPGPITKIILANTAPRFATREIWESRIEAVREGGMQALVETAMGRFFTPQTLAHDPYAQSVKNVFLGTDPAGYSACCAALRDTDLTSLIAKINLPTLVIGGDQDPSTPWEGHGEVLARNIRGAKALRLDSAHLSNIGKAREFTGAVLEFL